MHNINIYSQQANFDCDFGGGRLNYPSLCHITDTNSIAHKLKHPYNQITFYFDTNGTAGVIAYTCDEGMTWKEFTESCYENTYPLYDGTPHPIADCFSTGSDYRHYMTDSNDVEQKFETSIIVDGMTYTSYYEFF